MPEIIDALERCGSLNVNDWIGPLDPRLVALENEPAPVDGGGVREHWEISDDPAECERLLGAVRRLLALGDAAIQFTAWQFPPQPSKLIGNVVAQLPAIPQPGEPLGGLADENHEVSRHLDIPGPVRMWVGLVLGSHAGLAVFMQEASDGGAEVRVQHLPHEKFVKLSES